MVDLFAPGLIVGSPQAEGEPISIERTIEGTVDNGSQSFETLVDAAPKHVEVTVRLSARSHTERIPVFVDETTMTQ